MLVANELEERCQMCGSTIEFHLQHPSGVNFVLPSPVRWIDELLGSEDLLSSDNDIMVCDGFVDERSYQMSRNQMIMYRNSGT